MSELRPLVLSPALNPTLVTDGAGLEKVRDFLEKNKTFGWDCETTFVKDFYWRKCRTQQFGTAEEQYVIDLLAFADGKTENLRDSQGQYGKNVSLGLRHVFDTLSPFLCSGDYLKVGVNLGFEYEIGYWNFGLRTFNFYDCMLAEKCIYAGYHSLKHYAFYSMEEMFGRYFGMQVDKTLQDSFNIESPLTEAQVAYAALDTRLPLGIRAYQNIILSGKTLKQIQTERPKIYEQMRGLPEIIFGDDLREVAQIENDAIGSFVDMHVHGDLIDAEKWTAKDNKSRDEFKGVIGELDSHFLPIVGSKHAAYSDDEIERAAAVWKEKNEISEAELKLKADIRTLKKTYPEQAAVLEQQRAQLEVERKAEKDRLKEIASTMSKHRTKVKNLMEKCEGEALINYGSGPQLMENLPLIDKKLKNLDNTDDETLEKFEHIPVMASLRKYRGLAKELKTYGLSWIQKWTTHPCKEEGWLHPGDGRLHCEFNQYEAETGRSSSSQPNAQNLPQDKATRSCFIAGPPELLSTCCGAEVEEIEE